MTEFSREEITTLAEVFPPVRAARTLLREAGFPMTELPAAPDTAVGFWEQVSESLAHGVLADGRRLIMRAAARRFPDQRVFAAAGESWNPLRVLVLGASPTGTGRIRPDREAKAIEAAAGDRLLVRYCPAASATALQQALDFRPDIIHLACHGTGTDLIFEDIFGEEHAVRADDVVSTLKLYRDLEQVRLRGLVLGSCDGDRIASGFADVAERVVAHGGPLDDECAVIFAGQLYQTLGRLPDIAAAALLAAQHAVLTDETCAGLKARLLILPTDA